MSDELSFRARSILNAFQYHQKGRLVVFWGLIFDEEGYIWSAETDVDVEKLVEGTFLRAAPVRRPTPFLRAVAKGENLRLHPKRVWRITEQFKKFAA